MISTLFVQFRHQYASGSVITELLMTHADQYLVKATIIIGEQIVATALAADSDLATADDQAKLRVLAMLGLGSEQSKQPIPQNAIAPHPQPAAANQPIDQSNPNIEAQPLSSVSSETSIEPSPVDDLGDAEDMGRPIDSILPDEAPAPAEVPASSLAAAALESFDNSNPVDLSDIIAQTDVEMSRLGWSSVQGRQYLETTFNKRSRQQLTDEELLTFLLYLESQPTPSMR